MRGEAEQAVQLDGFLAAHFLGFFAPEKIQAAGFRAPDLPAPDAPVDPAADGALQFGETALHEFAARRAGRHGDLDAGPGLIAILAV